MNAAALIGYSGHAYVMIDVLKENGYSKIYYCDQNQKKYNPFNIIFLGHERDESTLTALRSMDVFFGVGDNKLRSMVYPILDANFLSMPSLFHPSAIIAESAQIGKGSAILMGVKINSLAMIGKGTICNTGSIIEHECNISDFVHVAPGAVIAGKVTVGKGSFIGANSVIKQGVIIGENVVVGAGSVVVRDLESNKTYFGNPAREYVK